jgi:hypothetical protein
MFEVFEELDKFNHIIYYDQPHTYEVDGVRMTSVTKLISKAEKPFDAAYWSQKKAEEEGVTADEIKARWKRKADIACEKGTAVHEYVENYLSNKVFPYPASTIRAVFEGTDPVRQKYNKIIPLVHKFCEDIKGKMIPVRSEFVVGDMEYGLCGMIDQIFYNKKSGKLELWDWKTNEKIDTDSRYKLQAPVDHISNAKLDIYSLQLSLYKHIIEKNTNLELGDSYLTWFNESNDSYEIFKCRDYENEVKEMINTFLLN